MSTAPELRAFACFLNPVLQRLFLRAADELERAQRTRDAAEHDLKMLMKASEHACLVCADGDCENSPDCEPEWRGTRAGKGEVE